MWREKHSKPTERLICAAQRRLLLAKVTNVVRLKPCFIPKEEMRDHNEEKMYKIKCQSCEKKIYI